MRLLLTLLYAAAANAALAAGDNLVFHDDFEAASTQSPPPGWAMWGAAPYKVPANYTRDTTNPHSGRACFRIHHPANTGGYVVVGSAQVAVIERTTRLEQTEYAIRRIVRA